MEGREHGGEVWGRVLAEGVRAVGRQGEHVPHRLVVAHRLRNKAFPARRLSFCAAMGLRRVELGSRLGDPAADLTRHLMHLRTRVLFTGPTTVSPHPELEQHGFRRAVVAVVKLAAREPVLVICRAGDRLEVKHGAVVVGKIVLSM